MKTHKEFFKSELEAQVFKEVIKNLKIELDVSEDYNWDYDNGKMVGYKNYHIILKYKDRIISESKA